MKRRADVKLEDIDGKRCAIVPLLGCPEGRCAVLEAVDWQRISALDPLLWLIEPRGPYECVVASRSNKFPSFTDEMVARLIARSEDGFAVLSRNGDAHLRRSNLVLRNVTTGREKCCPPTYRLPRRPREVSRNVIAATA